MGLWKTIKKVAKKTASIATRTVTTAGGGVAGFLTGGPVGAVAGASGGWKAGNWIGDRIDSIGVSGSGQSVEQMLEGLYNRAGSIIYSNAQVMPNMVWNPDQQIINGSVVDTNVVEGLFGGFLDRIKGTVSDFVGDVSQPITDKATAKGKKFYIILIVVIIGVGIGLYFLLKRK